MLGKTLICHPKNVEVLRKTLDRDAQSPSPLFSIPIIADDCVPMTRKTGKTLFPKDKFIEYEPEDAKWMLPLGMAKEETELVFYLVDDRMLGFSSVRIVDGTGAGEVA